MYMCVNVHIELKGPCQALFHSLPTCNLPVAMHPGKLGYCCDRPDQAAVFKGGFHSSEKSTTWDQMNVLR